MRIALLIMAGCTLAAAQTFSNISTSNDLDHETVRIVGNVSVDSYVRINCGMTTGGPYTATSTTSYMTGLHGDSGEVVVDLGGLTPSTTYYCVPTARPNPNNSTGLVTGSEFNFTTLASPAHPAYPTAPAVYNPTASYPTFTTGYTIVRMIAGTAGGECRAAYNVGPVTYGSGTWSVAAGDTVQSVLNKVGYGAILEFDEGITCPVPGTNTYNGGYILPVKAADPNASGINDPAHRWIVLRTNQGTPAHFPPVGFRTGPSWDTYTATFQAQVPASLCCATGQHFYSDQNSGLAHHYWMYDLHLTVNPSVPNGPWYAFIELGSNADSFNKTNPPQYFVIDRVHFDCPGLPIQCQGAIWGIPGGNVAFTNNYIGIFDNGSNGTLAQGIYWTDCTGGPLYHDNNFISAIGQGFYIESNSVIGCGQAPTSAVSPTDITFTHNALYWPLSTLHSSFASNPAWDGYSRAPNRNQIESKRARRVLIQGNLIDGQWSGQNEGSSVLISGNADITLGGQTGNFDWNVTFNLTRHSANVFNCMGTRPLVNPGPPDNAAHRRILFANNLAYSLGRYDYAMSGSEGGLYSGYFINENGCQDTTVQQNTFGFSNPDSGSSGFQFIPDILFVGGGGQPLSEGFYFRNNIAYFGVGNPTSYTGIVWDNEQNCCSASAYLANPLPVNTNQMTLWQSSMVRIASSVVANGTWGANVMIGSTQAFTNIEPWPDLTQAQLNTYSANMPGVGSNVTALISADIYPTGATMAARQASAGLLNAANNDYTCTPTPQNPCAAGVNLKGLESAMGIVSNIVVRPGPSALQFTYIAPDARVCSVDTSPDGVTWTRTTDSGGSRVRTGLVSSLAANTAFQYRLMCYYSQTATWFSFPSDPSNLVTDGRIANTAAAGTRTLSITFQMPGDASSAEFTLVPVGGTPISQTCSSSPCAISNVPNGAVLVQIAYLNGGGATVSDGSIWTQ